MAIDGRRDPSEYWRQVVPPFLCPATVLKNSHFGVASFLVEDRGCRYFNLWLLQVVLQMCLHCNHAAGYIKPSRLILQTHQFTWESNNNAAETSAWVLQCSSQGPGSFDATANRIQLSKLRHVHTSYKHTNFTSSTSPRSDRRLGLPF